MPRSMAGRPLSLEFFKSLTPLEKIPSTPPQYLVEHEDRLYLLERHGRCDYQRCRSICCRMLCLNLEWNDYVAGFAERGIVSPLILRTCRYLAVNGACRRWQERTFPRACDNFPVPGDPLYLEVMNACSFFFLLVRDGIARDSLDRQTS